MAEQTQLSAEQERYRKRLQRRGVTVFELEEGERTEVRINDLPKGAEHVRVDADIYVVRAHLCSELDYWNKRGIQLSRRALANAMKRAAYRAQH